MNTFVSFLTLVSLATVAGCAAHADDAAGVDSTASDVVGVTDLTEMEAALGLEKDEQLPSGAWSRSDERLHAGPCWKSRFASADHVPSHWEFRRYKTGAAFFRKLGTGPLDGDERPVACVDVDFTNLGGSDVRTQSFEGLALDMALRLKLGKFQGSEDHSGRRALYFDRNAVEIQEGSQFCYRTIFTGGEESTDPALKAGALGFAGGADGYAACEAAFAIDAKGDGTIDRPAFNGFRFLSAQDESVEPSVAAFAYRFAMQRGQALGKFSMAADPIGAFKEHKVLADADDDVTVFEKMEVHHIKVSWHSEALYLTPLNETGDPAKDAVATCTRRLKDAGTPTSEYACTGL